MKTLLQSPAPRTRRPYRYHARAFAVLPPSRSYGRWSARLRRWRAMQRASRLRIDPAGLLGQRAMVRESAKWGAIYRSER